MANAKQSDAAEKLRNVLETLVALRDIILIEALMAHPLPVGSGPVMVKIQRSAPDYPVDVHERVVGKLAEAGLVTVRAHGITLTPEGLTLARKVWDRTEAEIRAQG